MDKPDAPRRIVAKKDRNDPVTEALMDAVLIEKLPMKARMEQASKPLYLTRYE